MKNKEKTKAYVLKLVNRHCRIKRPWTVKLYYTLTGQRERIAEEISDVFLHNEISFNHDKKIQYSFENRIRHKIYLALFILLMMLDSQLRKRD